MKLHWSDFLCCVVWVILSQIVTTIWDISNNQISWGLHKVFLAVFGIPAVVVLFTGLPESDDRKAFHAASTTDDFDVFD